MKENKQKDKNGGKKEEKEDGKGEDKGKSMMYQAEVHF